MKSDFRSEHLQRGEFRLIPFTYNFMINCLKKTLQKSQVSDNWPSINWAHHDDICAVQLFCCRPDSVTLPYPSLIIMMTFVQWNGSVVDKILLPCPTPPWSS